MIPVSSHVECLNICKIKGSKWFGLTNDRCSGRMHKIVDCHCGTTTLPSGACIDDSDKARCEAFLPPIADRNLCKACTYGTILVKN
jgi:hypothetical protein